MKKLINNILSLSLNYKTPSNINYFWNFGSLSIFFLIIQIFTGFFLAFSYIAHIDFAFNSVEYIMREIPNGWLIRYLHANGASFFFFVVYFHIGRSLFYGSFQKPLHLVWLTGLCLFILIILTAFAGYVLPWGQMSYWAATVITSLSTAIPFIGGDILYLLWGNFGIGQETLTRFFAIHFILPFVILFFVIIHLFVLHNSGSTNPIAAVNVHFVDKIPFHPYFLYKDLVGIFFFLTFFILIVFFKPNMLMHPINYSPADFTVTPSHIVPEWYFLPFYAILRAIPSKFFGVLCMFSSIIILITFVFVNNQVLQNLNFLRIYQNLVFFFFINFVFLGWLGAQVMEFPFVLLAQISTIVYFFLIFLILGFIKVSSLNSFEILDLISLHNLKVLYFKWCLFQWGEVGVSKRYRYRYRFFKRLSNKWLKPKND